jgi:pimeloyl-ACP methyl ester carboxylesterase
MAPMSLPGRLVDVGGTSVFVHRRGQGPALVLVHGFLMSHWYWRDVVDRLAQAYDVIAIDLPGFGESDRPSPSRYPYSLEAMGRTVLGLLDELGVERFALLGHSMGGGVALDVASQAAERVLALVLASAAAYAPLRPPPLSGILLAPGLGETLFRRGLTRRRFGRDLRRLAYLLPESVKEEAVDYWWDRLCRPGGPEAAYAMLGHLMRLSPFSERLQLSPLRIPTLLVWGEQDALVPLELGRRLSRELGAPLRVVPMTGHTPHEERPAAFLQIVLPFLESALAARERTGEPCRSAF